MWKLSELKSKWKPQKFVIGKKRTSMKEIRFRMAVDYLMKSEREEY
jgi:hypothetical protein